MANTLEPLARRQPLHHSVQEAIRTYIIDNRLRPGDMLPPETEFVRRLGVSRTSVREAVKALESIGILEVRHGSGLAVRQFSLQPLLENITYGSFDLDELAELTEIRRVLEIGMIEAALQRMSAATLDELRQIVAQMGAAAERDHDYMVEDRRFHQLLFAGLNNQTLLTLLDVFWLTFNKATAHADLRGSDPISTYRDHLAIVEAIAAGDSAEARRALDRHYDGLKDRITQERAG
jgi:DNA-binding FadR family transcriptional regulator